MQVVYNSKAQLLDEEPKLEKLAADLEVPITPTTSTSEVRSEPGKLILLDEGDAILLDQRLKVEKLPDYNSPVIALTATGPTDMSNFEKSHFNKLGYEVVDSMLRPQFKATETPTLGSLDHFFGKSFDDTVRLVFVEEDREEELRRKAVEKGYDELDVLVNPEDLT